MQKVFIDTAYFIAAFDSKDQLHQVAKEKIRELGVRQYFTSNLVIVEFLNYYAGWEQETKLAAANSVERLYEKSTQMEIIHITDTYLKKSREFYKKRSDKGYSLTDCSSMLLMKENGISLCLTSDRHFRQEGFKVLLSDE